MTKLFISYSHVDNDDRKELVDLLENVYDDIWCDEELITGSRWSRVIEHEIETCDHFLYLFSPEALESPYCTQEINHARKHNKHIVPIRVRARTELPEDLTELQYIDWYETSHKLKNLARIIGSIVQSDEEKRREQEQRATEERILTYDEVILQALWDYLDERKHQFFLRFPRHAALNGSDDSFYNLDMYLRKRRRTDYVLLDNELEALFCALDAAILKFTSTFADWTLEPSPVDEFIYFDVDHPDAEARERYLDALWDDVREGHRRIFKLVRVKYPSFFDEK